MPHIAGHNRSQALLLPESVDDYVGPENPVRFIDAFVDGLNLAAAGFVRVAPQVTGRPGYAPKDLLKLYPALFTLGRVDAASCCVRRQTDTQWRYEALS